MPDAALIYPCWPAPANVRAVSTTRQGGVSQAPWDSFNLGGHVGDEPAAVVENRQRLVQLAAIPEAPCWLQQVHGNKVVTVAMQGCAADACITRETGKVCAVMTADCLPLLMCDRQGNQVAAVHAGWRGLADGVIENTLNGFACPPQDILVWLGPAIGPTAFEVGAEVVRAFVRHHAQTELAFVANRVDHWLADIYQLARIRLAVYGVEQVFGGEECTYSDSQRFFSYRRDGQTGRMASLIWLRGDDE